MVNQLMYMYVFDLQAPSRSAVLCAPIWCSNMPSGASGLMQMHEGVTAHLGNLAHLGTPNVLEVCKSNRPNSLQVVYKELTQTNLSENITTGLYAPPIIKKWGSRPLTMACSVFLSAGYLLSSLTPNLKFLYFSMGILMGKVQLH